jgi:hypothetical protein
MSILEKSIIDYKERQGETVCRRRRRRRRRVMIDR